MSTKAASQVFAVRENLDLEQMPGGEPLVAPAHLYWSAPRACRTTHVHHDTAVGMEAVHAALRDAQRRM